MPRPGMRGRGWKYALSQVSVDVRVPAIHMVEQYLRLADAIGISRESRTVPPRPANADVLTQRLGPDWSGVPYAVLHPVPLNAYKAWTLEGWAALVGALTRRGLRVVLTAGPVDEERAFVGELATRCAAAEDRLRNLAGLLQFAQLTPLIECARVFVGPDTSVTHLAAATGTPTVALFGPSPPVNWGPWPQGFSESGDSPWVMSAPLQQRGNVWIVQGMAHCVPCKLEGCERRRDSRSLCLDELPAARVLVAADQALASPPRSQRSSR